MELAAELNDFLRSGRRYYPKLKEQDCKIILLHSGDRILPVLSAGLAELALTKMQKRGIEIRLNTRVARVDDRGVELQSGERIDGGTVIGTVGTAPTEMVQRLPLPKQRGRIETAADDTSRGGMQPLPSRRRRSKVPPAKIGSISQAAKLAQAARDLKN